MIPDKSEELARKKYVLWSYGQNEKESQIKYIVMGMRGKEKMKKVVVGWSW